MQYEVLQAIITVEYARSSIKHHTEIQTYK